MVEGQFVFSLVDEVLVVVAEPLPMINLFILIHNIITVRDTPNIRELYS